MIVYPETHQGVFLARPNRFLARVLLEGEEQLCHVRNTGRCRELLIPGTPVWCCRHQDPGRKTQWSLITVQKGERLVNLDSQVPNRLAAQWVREGGLGTTPAGLQAERTFGDSRFDLAFQLEGRRCFLEVKGVTLERDGTACFPDAPTARGAKHLRGLKQAAQMGYGAYVLFVCQMGGITRLEPNWDADPLFSGELSCAAAAGVNVLAVECSVERDAIAVTGRVPVRLRQG